MLEELRSITVFAKTAELGSFRAAAKALKLSPSVVSYHVSQLEARYDIALLYRSTRKLSLTEEGRKLFDHARVISEEAEFCLDILARDAISPAGTLKLSVPAVLTQSRLSQHIAEFCKRFPQVKLSISYTDARQDLISEGIDVAIRIGQMADSNLKAKGLGKLKRKLVCAADYYAAKPLPSHPHDLNSWSWIHLSMLPASRSFRRGRGKAVKTDNEASIEVNSVEATCQLAVQGLGLASPPDFMVDPLITEGKLVHVLPDWQMEDIPVYAVWPENVKRTSLANLFVTHLSETKQQLF